MCLDFVKMAMIRAVPLFPWFHSRSVFFSELYTWVDLSTSGREAANNKDITIFLNNTMIFE